MPDYFVIWADLVATDVCQFRVANASPLSEYCHDISIFSIIVNTKDAQFSAPVSEAYLIRWIFSMPSIVCRITVLTQLFDNFRSRINIVFEVADCRLGVIQEYWRLVWMSVHIVPEYCSCHFHKFGMGHLRWDSLLHWQSDKEWRVLPDTKIRS